MDPNLSIALSLASRPELDFGPESSSAVPVNSISEAYDRLRSFLEVGPCDEDLLLRMAPAIYTSHPVQQLLQIAAKNKCRFEFDSEFEILKLKAMPRPLHDVISLYTTQLFIKACRDVLTADEGDYVGIMPAETVLSGQHLLSPGHKPEPFKKTPDSALAFLGDDLSPAKLRIVSEVGITQSYDDLLRDAVQWLLRSRDEVKLAVIVKIDEDTTALRAHQKREEFIARRRQLVNDYGNSISRDRYGFDETASDISSSDSSSSDHAGLVSDVITDDWVGSLSAFLEIWEMKDGRIALREPRINILPRPEYSRKPSIRVTDLIPESSRSMFEPFDDSRVLEMDLDDYRTHLDYGRKETALGRAIKVVCPRTSRT